MRDGSHTVTVANRLEELERLYAALEGFAQSAGLPDPARRTLLLVAEELFTNVVRHGYSDDAEDGIVATVRQVDAHIVLELRDHGRPFDTAGTPRPPDNERPMEDITVGGLGLFLIHAVASSITSRREGMTNVTEVRLPVDAVS